MAEMIEKKFDTRIQHKRDTYAKWMSSSLILKPGEFAVAYIPAEAGALQQEPATVVKVGDGEHTFAQLPFLTAKAGDIYAWARADKKPTYEAAEITGIADYIAEYVQDTMGISVDTNDVFRIVKVDNYNYKLQTKAKNDPDTEASWKNVAESAIVIPDDTSAIAEAKKAGDDAAEALEAYIESNNKALADEIKRAGDAETALSNKIGDVPDNKTVVQMISDAQTAATYDDTKVKEDIKANADNIAIEKGRVDILVGDDDGKSARTIANEELTKQLVPANAKEALDTLAEIAAWIQEHPEDASAMNEAITALQNKIGEIPGGTTVKAYVDNLTESNFGEITGVKGRVVTLETLAAEVEQKKDSWDAALGDAKDHANALNTDMDNRVKELEKIDHDHENKTVLDGVTSQKVTAWDNAEKNAKDYTDALENSLSAIAKSGSVNDLIQPADVVLIFDCGGSGVTSGT